LELGVTENLPTLTVITRVLEVLVPLVPTTVIVRVAAEAVEPVNTVSPTEPVPPLITDTHGGDGFVLKPTSGDEDVILLRHTVPENPLRLIVRVVPADEPAGIIIGPAGPVRMKFTTVTVMFADWLRVL
jgi:hypothetical protein